MDCSEQAGPHSDEGCEQLQGSFLASKLQSPHLSRWYCTALCEGCCLSLQTALLALLAALSPSNACTTCKALAVVSNVVSYLVMVILSHCKGIAAGEGPIRPCIAVGKHSMRG